MKRKQIYFGVLLLIMSPLLFLMFLPTPALENSKQINLARWISQNLFFEQTVAGEFAYFDLFVKTYLTLLSPFGAALIMYHVVKDDRTKIPKLNQFKLLDAVIVLIIFFVSIGLALALSLWNLNPSIVQIHVKKSYLFISLYEFKLGIIFIELFYCSFLLFAITGILGFLLAILINSYQYFSKTSS